MSAPLADAYLGLLGAALAAILAPWWLAVPAILVAGALVHRAAHHRRTP